MDPIVSICILVSGIYVLNFQMAADHMFYQHKRLLMVSENVNKVGTQRLVIGVVSNTIANAYHIKYLGFHHEVAEA